MEVFFYNIGKLVLYDKTLVMNLLVYIDLFENWGRDQWPTFEPDF